MFAPKHYYAQPQYIDFAALAEARAAEASAKAAEAEYLARQAEARARTQSPYWTPTAPSPRCSNQFSCACAGCTGLQQPIFGYSPYYEEDYAPRSPYPFGGYSRPQWAHYHHQPHHGNRHTHRALAELDLETQLRKERLARLKLEEELEQLKDREQQLARARCLLPPPNRCPTSPPSQSQLPLADPTNKRPAHKQPKALHRDDTKLNTLFGAPRAPQPYGLVWPHPSPKPRAAATKPVPVCKRPPITPEDVIANMILQNIDVNRYKNITNQKQPKPKAPTVSEEAPKRQPEQPKKLVYKGSLIDQLKARYEREGQDEIRDTIQSVVNSLLTPAEQQQSTKEPSSSALHTNQTRGNAPRAAPCNDYGFDLIEAILGNFNGSYNQSYVRPEPTAQTTSSSASTKASATAASTNTKGKEKESLSPAIGTTDRESTSRDVVNALQKVESIEHSFHSLEADFTFPSQLDFAPSPASPTALGATAVFPTLSFTARNHPVRYYEQTLSSLLQELDLIESYGNPTLRLKRKMTVSVIEKALEELEREVAGRWKASVAKEEQKKEKATEVNATESTESSPETTTATTAEAEPEAPKSVRIPIVESTRKEVEVFATPEDPLTEGPAPSSSEEYSTPAPDTETAGEHAPIGESLPVTLDSSSSEELTPAEDVPSSEGVSSEPPSLLPEQITTTDSESTPDTEQLPENPSPIVDTAAEEATPSTVQEDVPAPISFDLAEAEVSTPASPSASSPKVIEEDSVRDSISDDDSDAFLLAQPSPLAFKQESKAKKRASVEVEDLGSEWEDVDEAQ